jgi:3-isopropylmalate dehydrogenase
VTKRIAIIAGDGIGVDVTAEAVKVLEALRRSRGLPLELMHFDWGVEKYLREGVALPPGAVETLRHDFDAIFLGAVGDPRVPSNRHAAEILLGLRFGLDLFANVRPAKLLDDRLCPLKGRTAREVSFVVIRENTEGAYAGLGGNFKIEAADEVALQEDVNTRKGVKRILLFAFEYARRKSLKRLCMSDKSNAMPYGHGLWQRVFAEVRARYPEIQSRHLYADTLAMEMVRDPSQFDVIVTSNLLGDILSDLGAQLAGGIGLAPSANLHPGRTSMFETVHGSAPDLAGKNLANPMAAILTAAMMLDFLGFSKASGNIERAVAEAVRQGFTTPDLGGRLGTREVGDWICRRLG